ncbi:hypothetical protein HM1_3150 [Heliomicrobium modesticaldum Ice1]|uniref:Uncharacterized protein n=1 Tax=Heliobacterium modesticaldum (strain ATCC 51547 / Ice1) TaxID=498761 RepID=B0TIG7_HELMI|nr:hypothetical protein HM1_3150 [Heliomicrobium modesticaldum Ice1]
MLRRTVVCPLTRIQSLSHRLIEINQSLFPLKPVTRSLKIKQLRSCVRSTSTSRDSAAKGSPATVAASLHRKEVIQPHLPIRLPCYDFTPIIDPTFGGCLLAVSAPTSGVADFRGVTGGVYKARERIHRGMLTRDY